MANTEEQNSGVVSAFRVPKRTLNIGGIDKKSRPFNPRFNRPIKRNEIFDKLISDGIISAVSFGSKNCFFTKELSEENKASIAEIIQSVEHKFNTLVNIQDGDKEEVKQTVSDALEEIKTKLWEAENHIKTAVREQLYEYSAELDVPNKLDYLLQSISTINKDTSELVGEVEALKYTSQEVNDTTSQVKNYLEETKADVKDSLRDLQEQFVLQMLQVFENINFSTETEEIIDFVDETNSEIKAELENEKKKRDEAEQALLHLLEETCNKLDNADK